MEDIFICHHEHIFEYRDTLIEKHPVFVSTSTAGRNTCCFATKRLKPVCCLSQVVFYSFM